MKKREDNLKKLLTNILIVFIILQPILDIYWLLENPIISIFNVSISTVIRLGIVGMLFLLFIFLYRKEKKIWFYLFYCLLFVIYFLIHNYYNVTMFTYDDQMYGYNTFNELFYIIRMCLPVIIIFITSNQRINRIKFNMVISLISLLTAGTIVVTNLFKVSFGSYVTQILSYNILDWFKLTPIPNLFYSTASRGYFSFANMISALLFGISIFILYKIYSDFSIKNMILLIFQFLAMFMLGTKIATYGILINLIGMLFVYLFFTFLKKENKFSFKSFLISIMLIGCWFIVYPHSPCYFRNISSSINLNNANSKDIGSKKSEKNDLERHQTKNETQREKNKTISNDPVFNFVISNYSLYSIRDDYILKKYPASLDPEFWLGIFDEDSSDRIDNRFLSAKILNRLKEVDGRSIYDYIGVGYSRMSSIVYLEKDFVSHYYIIGIFGLLIFFFPYLYIIIYSIISILLDKKLFNFRNVSILIALSFGLISTYFCGNSLDSLTFSLIYSFIAGYLYSCIKTKNFNLKEDKVTILALHLGVGGVEKYFSSLTKVLSKDYKVEIISSYKVLNKPIFDYSNADIKYLINDRPYKNEFVEALRCKNIKNIIIYGLKNVKILFLKYFRERRAILNIDSKYVITTRFHSDLVGKILDDNYIKIATEHNYHNNNNKYIKKIVKSVINFNYLVCVSDELAKFYESKCNCKCIYIPNVIDGIPELKLKKENNMLISVGRLVYEKGYSDLIDVVNIVKNKVPNIKLKIIGDGYLRNELEVKIKQLDLNDNIVLLGMCNQEQINEEMQKSSLYVMSSITESFGIVLLEAMSNHLCCIAFDSANGAKTLLSKYNGILIKNRDKKVMAEKIIYYLEHKKDTEKYINNAIISLEKYSIENIRKEWYKIMKNDNIIKFFDNIYRGTKDEFCKQVYKSLKDNKKKFIITANPEAFMFGKMDIDVEKMLLDKETSVVADGIGLVKAAKIIGINIPERIPGVDISEELFKYGNELKKSIYLFGSKQEVLDMMVNKLNKNYPNLKIAGYQNGYVKDKDKVFQEIIKCKPDIVLVALGMPNQEKLIYKYIDKFDKGIFVGVGGSLDVLSGSKKRAPKIFIKLNLEWLYRILKEPKRIKRFYNNNVKFLYEIKKYK